MIAIIPRKVIKWPDKVQLFLSLYHHRRVAEAVSAAAPYCISQCTPASFSRDRRWIDRVCGQYTVTVYRFAAAAAAATTYLLWAASTAFCSSSSISSCLASKIFLWPALFGRPPTPPCPPSQLTSSDHTETEVFVSASIVGSSSSNSSKASTVPISKRIFNVAIFIWSEEREMVR